MKPVKTNAEVRVTIGHLFQDTSFALTVANLGKTTKLTQDEWDDVAKSLPKFYAVVEAAEVAVLEGLATSLVDALEQMAEGKGTTFHIACICARLGWQAQQPLLGVERLARPIMGFTSGSLSPKEFDKDAVRVKATAQLVLDNIS